MRNTISAMIRLVLVLAGLVIVAGATASLSAGVARWFHSPSGNISCEVKAGPTVGTYASCFTQRPPRCVNLKPSGQMSVQRGLICIGNPPEGAFTLQYGRSIRVGPFRCTSRRDGMRCVVVRTGHGFLISREAVKRF